MQSIPYISALSGIPGDTPAFIRSYKILSKAASVGFVWPDAGSVVAKIAEECAEVKKAAESGDKRHLSEETGDVLSALVTLVCFTNTDPSILTHTMPGDTASLSQIEEKLLALRHAIDAQEPPAPHITALLSAILTYARSQGIDPEAALQSTNDKFVYRFDAVGKALHADGLTMAGTPLKAMIKIWNAQKPQPIQPSFGRA